MKTYIAFISQGGGCDYTIACGETVIKLDATSMEEANQKLLERIRENYSHEEKQLNEATIYEVDQVCSVDLKEIYERINNAKYEEQLKRKEEAERKEFERLQSKFGNGKERANIQV